MDICPEQRIDPPESAEDEWVDLHFEDDNLKEEYLNDDETELDFEEWLRERYRNTV